jgi:hypothetical protein
LRTAFHEAGHAVAAHLASHQIRYVTIVPLGGYDGHTRVWVPDIEQLILPGSTNASQEIWNQIAAMLAGPVSEFLACGEEIDREGIDYDRVRKFLALLRWKGLESIIGASEKLAMRELCEHWESVRVLAERLLVDLTVDGTLAHQILQDGRQ